ncbi:MAG: hypothetical protein ACYDGR_09505 [Candidatus Dormibacteria bacterium]
MPRRIRAGLVWGALLVSVILAAGCAPPLRADGLLFVQDRRLLITSPADHAVVSTPTVIRWRFAGRTDTRFQVFVDRAPQPPGETLDWFVRFDRTGIYETTATELPLNRIARFGRDGTTRENLHEITVVIADTSGRRIGETEAYVDFYVQVRR